MDDVLKEMERVARAFQAPDQILELDIQKVINHLRSEKAASKEDIEALDKAMHAPGALAWKRVPVPEPPARFKPNSVELNFFRDMIEKATDGMFWQTPSTGHRYQIDKKAKTFTLVIDARNDPHGWHEKNKVCLAALGWTVVDSLTTSCSFEALEGEWKFVVFDFPIDTQENPGTPGQNHPAGSRGQDAMATMISKGVVVRLGHVIGREFMKHVQKASPDFGVGKSTAAGSIE